VKVIVIKMSDAEVQADTASAENTIQSDNDGAESKNERSSSEAAEEAKLKSKYPSIGRPMAGHSAFLQKRLAKGQKYFDSGDYQMAKQKPATKSRMPPLLAQPTGDTIPTPESVPVRKTSIIQQSKLSTAS